MNSLDQHKTITLAQASDLEAIQQVFALAREQMVVQGNASQWASTYPSDEKLLHDISNQELYLCHEEGKLCGVFALIFGDDPTYEQIEGGVWLNDRPYATVHRVAGNGQVKGLGRFVLNWCLARSKNLRVDTHANNVVMLHLLRDLGFTECGVIYVADGTPRVAFQKSL